MTTTDAFLQSDNDALYVEVTFPGGSIARWVRIHDDGTPIHDAIIEDLTDAIERIIGSPDTLLT